MPLLPDMSQMEQIEARCLELMAQGNPLSAVETAEQLMALPGLPMHCPYHHFLLPAALLTAARLRTGGTVEQLEKDLKTAKERAGSVPGGFCGQYGCCGAAIGAGIFASVWQGTSPLSKHGWADGNRLTARCLEEIATVEGPRCCKRVTYLALRAAIPAIRELLGVDLGEFPQVRCVYHENNRECRKEACPFFH